MLWSKLHLGSLAPTPATSNEVKILLGPAQVPAVQQHFSALRDVQTMKAFMISSLDSVGYVR